MKEITVYILKPKEGDDPPIVYSKDALRMAAPLVGGTHITKWLDEEDGDRKLDVSVGNTKVATLTRTIMMSTEACQPKQPEEPTSLISTVVEQQAPRIMTPQQAPEPSPMPQGSCSPKVMS